ncbi:leucyl/phenylalanyl-tRNA--protein transferase [Psychromonas sp. B3M02]|uniref:leucyl/phenylalanyl-tRNA--protein transferase n=1 Tax=Psychromonas sp. B3M02 TaxID=2267226 RepID=UPI000DEA178C|nr:leucyl/phenylalanyl-tRNA--protein transferase [Psychromonas sp. B3M02]RBW47370.1 leucyl/phenylalanyl-tRNA--protein transferase [Psychromonas sp. B3M02]
MTKRLIVLSEDNLSFPDPENALDDPDGLLAIGGDLSVPRLHNAYQQAVFPWFSEGEPILWWSPKQRAVIKPKEVHISKSMAKFIRQTTLTVTINHAFTEVIKACSQPRKTQAETWISSDIIHAYAELHQQGKAHSIEVWLDKQLVGGLYGVNVGAIFCGESMFHRHTNASKLAFIALCQHFQQHGGHLIDCQMSTPHLASLGVKEASRGEFLNALSQFKSQAITESCWDKQSLTV